MKISPKAYIVVGAIALALPAFQNCGSKNFSNSSQDSASSSDTAASAVVIPGGSAGSLSIPAAAAPTPLVPTNPAAAGLCYDVTCESDAGGFKTIHGMTNQQGVITGLAPTTGSSWVIAINSTNLVYSSLNCYPDQISQAPSYTGSSLCSGSAPATASQYSSQLFTSGVTFTGGKGRYLSNCVMNACGELQTDTYLDGVGFYEWVAGTYNATASTASVKLRARDYGNILGSAPFGIDSTVGVGNCDSQTAIVYNSSTNQNQTLSYSVCLDSSKHVTITSPQHTFTLSF